MSEETNGNDYEIVTSRRVRLRDSGESEPLYRPRIEEVSPNYYEIYASRRDDRAWTWGFWGILLVIGSVISIIIRAPAIFDFWSVITEIIGLAVGLLLFRWGRRTKLAESRIGALDLTRRVLHLDRGETRVISLDEITELVFGMTQYPVRQERPDVRIHAFTFLVRVDDGDLVPVIEASPHKTEAFDVAELFSKVLEMPISYVGEGIR